MRLWKNLRLKLAKWFIPKGWVISTFDTINKQEHETLISNRAYTSTVFSGVDIKLYMVPFGEKVEQLVPDSKDSNGNPVYTKVGCVGNVQAVWVYDKGDHFGGTMQFVIFDGLEEIESLRDKKMQLLVVGATGYGKVSTLLDTPIKFNKYYNWGFSIDDLCTEATINFKIIEDDK